MIDRGTIATRAGGVLGGRGGRAGKSRGGPGGAPRGGGGLALLRARSGGGRFRIVDRDYVEPSNLQRQTLFDENDAHESVPKAIAAARQIAHFNSQKRVQPS